jgi:hypothetical protein
LLKKSKLSLGRNKKVKVDSGYQGISKIHINSELPRKNTKLKPLTKKERAMNLKLSKIRVTVEHVIGKIKVFRIMAEKYRNRRRHHDLRMKLICGIYNFEQK